MDKFVDSIVDNNKVTTMEKLQSSKVNFGRIDEQTEK